MNRNQQLQQYTGWLHVVARNMTGDRLHDDLVQEGYIAMWRALGTHNPDKGPLDYWLKSHALNRMRSVVTGETMTTSLERKNNHGFTTGKGDETRRRIKDYVSQHPETTGSDIAKAIGITEATLSYHRRKMGTVDVASALTKETVSLEAMMADLWTYEWTPEEFQHTDNLEGIEVSYHAGEINEALDVLTPAQRKYVVARFWGGQSPSELRVLFGYDPSSLWRTAKPRLRIRLANLRELVGS